MHQKYDEQVIRMFYISHADATELATLINSVMRPRHGVSPDDVPNKTANTITVRAHRADGGHHREDHRANDKPRAEVVLDVEILEVNRTRDEAVRINLSNYALGPAVLAGGRAAATPASGTASAHRRRST